MTLQEILFKTDNQSGVILLAIDEVLKGMEIKVSVEASNMKLGPLLHFGDNFRSNTSQISMLQQSVNYQLSSL